MRPRTCRRSRAWLTWGSRSVTPPTHQAVGLGGYSMRLNMRRGMVLAWPHPKEGDPLGGAHYSFYIRSYRVVV